jgi:diguanylate cyclase (GGDEF)-like protein
MDDASTSDAALAAGIPRRRLRGGRLLGKGAWLWAAGALFLVGVVGSALGSLVLARAEANRARAGFRTASAQVASTLQLAIQHEQDLILAARGFILETPHATQAQFSRWAQSLSVFERYPEVPGFGFVELVPHADLVRYATTTPRARPSSRSPGTAQPLAVIPPGDRPFYCLAPVQYFRPGLTLPAGFDYCAGGGGSVLPASLYSRDTGIGAYVPYSVAGTEFLGIQSPVYRGGEVPGTVGARRRAFVGFVAMSVVPRVVFASAVQGHPGLALLLRYRVGASSATLSYGKPSGDRKVVVDTRLSDGWTLTVFGHRTSASVLESMDSVALLFGGLVLSGLTAVLLYTLGTSRARAMRLVAEKTSQLTFHALHDALTQLPNRTLVLDRAESALAHGRRSDRAVAALYIDIDGFKTINDTHGHAAGDRLLREVATRLRDTVREVDTVGRLGGDEFVVIIDDQPACEDCELVASRLLEELRRPVRIGPDDTFVEVTASIGIASGQRASADELLRDADRALYEAKAAGKDRYVVFEAAATT